MEKELTAFSLYLLRSGRRQSTTKVYINCLKRLCIFCNKLTTDNINKYLYHLQQQGRKATYLNHYVDTIRIYAKFKNTDYKIGYFKEQEPIKSTLSQKEIKQILNLRPATGGKKARDNWYQWTLFFKLMAYTGMRPGEVASLTTNSIDFGRGVFILGVTKTFPRLVPIPPTIISEIKEYLKTIPTAYLFQSKRANGVFNNVDWSYNFHKRLDMLGIKRENLSIYSLRHSFITRLLEEDINIFKVQKIVGHRQIKTTAHYTHLTTKDMLTTITKDPLARERLSPKIILQQILEVLKTFKLQDNKKIDYEIRESPNKLHLTISFKSAIQ